MERNLFIGFGLFSRRYPMEEISKLPKTIISDLEEAKSFLYVKKLRDNYLGYLTATCLSFQKYKDEKKDFIPWQLFDKGFSGRESSGKFLGGPVDSFKVRCSATLFWAASKECGDKEVERGCAKLISFFVGDCSYMHEKKGGKEIVLNGFDEQTPKECGTKT